MHLPRPGLGGLSDPTSASSASLIARLPPHLRHPGAYDCLDLSLATEYLLSRNNVPGILACIATRTSSLPCPKGSIPRMLVCAVGRTQTRDRLSHSEYRMWLRRERQVLDVLRRKIDPVSCWILSA